MPLQNRVDPFGKLIAAPARGTLMGNRGGRFHTDAKTLAARRWVSRQWICCLLEFNDRHRDVWGRFYTEMFFLDEVTAFAAGHRPCFECRRQDAEHFARLFLGGASRSARPRESGDREPDSRLCGNERRAGRRASAEAMDEVLHAERLSGKEKRTHARALDGLPDGAMIALEGDAFAVRGGHLLRWTPSGYADRRARPRGIEAQVLTPPSILAVLAGGYRPLWHRSAG
jgi:hypothetical protein